MSTFVLCPLATILQYFTDTGIVLSGGLIWTYAAGTSTPTPTWTDSTGTVQNSNPIQLNSAGRLNNVLIWQQSRVPLKIQISTNAGTPSVPVFGTQIGPTFDQISGIGDPSLIVSSRLTAANSSLVTVTSLQTPIVDLSLGNIVSGQLFLVSGICNMVKGGVTGTSDLQLTSPAGTGIIDFTGQSGLLPLMTMFGHASGNSWNALLSCIGQCTSPGSYTLRLAGHSLSSNSTVALGTGSLVVITIG